MRASEAVRREWLLRVEEEYRSAAIANHLTLWLVQIGASPALLDLGLRITKDELAHSASSHRVYLAAGGKGGPALARESLQLVRRHPGEPLELDVARVALQVFCLGETAAVHLFKKLREACSVPPARKALDRILRDEVRHRDFGWLLLEWLFEHPLQAKLRSLVERELPSAFALIRQGYAPEAIRTDDQMDNDDRTWGLMPPAEYARALDTTRVRDWIPRFARHGIDAQTAWDRATRSI